VLRPEDLLRWTPTGKAWASYRLGRVADAAFRRADLAFQFGQMKTFTLASDPADAPMAQRLREQLIAAGATEAPIGDDAAMPVVLLTNRTQFGWIDAQTARVRDSGLTVVGTAIGLPSSLDWLWRRQWIDFRTWNMRRTDVALSLPQVPDAVTQARLPAFVARVHHVLCAIAALVFALTSGVTADDAARSDGLSGYDLIAGLSFGVVVWWMLIAHRLVKRTRAASLLVRDWRIAWAVTAIVACIDSYALAQKGVAPARILLAMTLLVAAGIWLSRQRAGLAFWLPGEGGNGAVKGSVLGQSRDWSTLMWSSAYLLLWIPVVGSGG
jgi:hypothetical protein